MIFKINTSMCAGVLNHFRETLPLDRPEWTGQALPV